MFAAVAGLQAFDLGRMTIALGAELGWAGFSQRIGPEPRRGLSSGAFVGPAAVLELPIAKRLFLRLDVEAPIYVLRARALTGAGADIEATLRVAAGAGVFF